MPRKNTGGRPSIFGPKNVRAGGCRLVKGYLGKEAARLFDQAALRLSRLSGREVVTLSDADVIEYLVRGSSDTRTQLRKRR